MKNPKVSVVVPTFNEEKYIENALASITAQKGAPKYELIIADGKSSDNTVKIARKYADIVVCEPKRTVAAGRQKGALAAKGDVLVCANADTYYPPDWLANLVKPFERKGIIASLGRVVPRDGDLIDNVFAHGILHPASKVLTKINMHYVDSTNLAFTRNEFMKAGGFNTDLISGEDTELIKRMKRYGDVVYTPEAVAYISMRRVKKWGKLYYTYFHATNFLKTHLLGKGHDRYEPIRE